MKSGSHQKTGLLQKAANRLYASNPVPVIHDCSVIYFQPKIPHILMSNIILMIFLPPSRMIHYQAVLLEIQKTSGKYKGKCLGLRICNVALL